MKLFLTGLAVIVSAWGFSQIPEIGKQKKCYERYDSQGNVIPQGQRRYAEWQCGKLAGVVDCNDKLEYDQDRDIVFTGTYGKPFSGTCETCHMNGLIERRVSFVEGKQHGIDTTYYRSGCKKVIQNHLQGQMHGQWIYFYDSTGYAAWEMNYQLDQKHGKHIFFKANGDTTRWETYNNGLLHGVKRTYFSGSRLKREVTYNMGIMDGPFKAYNLKGLAIEEMTYKQGKKNDQAKYYFDDGTLLRTEMWNMGVKNGEFKTYFYQGNVQTSETYKKGVRIGWFTEYYPDSKTKQKILYDKKGKRIEEHRYDEQGRETYSFGTPDNGGAEDDEVPTGGKKKKKKR